MSLPMKSLKTLLVMRHAKSSWKDDNINDYDRGLNSRGKKDASRMGELLKDEGLVPDYIVTSSARRARKTADHVILTSGYRGECRLTEDLYMAGPDQILEVVRQTPSTCNRLLLIGHNPGLEDFLERLTGASAALPTAAVAIIQIAVDSWSAFTQVTKAKLVRLWQPRELA